MAAETFSWIIPDVVGGMARPGNFTRLDHDLRHLQDEFGIRAILSLTEEPLDRDALIAADVTYRHVPIPDFSAPTPGQIDEAVAMFTEVRRDSRPLAVHCAAGIGRTGTILACLLVSTGMGAEEAITTVRRLRPGSIEVAAQEDAIRGYAASLGHNA